MPRVKFYIFQEHWNTKRLIRFIFQGDGCCQVRRDMVQMLVVCGEESRLLLSFKGAGGAYRNTENSRWFCILMPSFCLIGVLQITAPDYLSLEFSHLLPKAACHD